ncbi:putative conserved oligomeric Golgi complex subunit 1 [Sesbania bispinosa]|nr:putative conserved oligomeric Golgi complex subunit 1 [Sesbania bispinosa]
MSTHPNPSNIVKGRINWGLQPWPKGFHGAATTVKFLPRHPESDKNTLPIFN